MTDHRWPAPDPSPGRLAALLLALLVLGGCGGPPEATEVPQAGLTADEFIEIVAQIREAERAVEGEDSAMVRFEARRDSILAAHDVTTEELHAFLRSEGGDIAALQAIWDSLTDRLKHVPESDDPFEAGLGQPIR